MRLPEKPTRGQPIRAELLGQIIDYLRAITPVAGPNIRVSHKVGGSIIEGQPGGGGAAAGTAPWAIRFHRTEDDADGKWEIWLPYGCMACGATLNPINKPMSEVAGHADDKAGWYLLPVDEEEGSADESGTREFEVVAHAKTSAKMDGVDALDAPARRLLYVEGHRQMTPEELAAATPAQLAEGKWGDEFSQMVARVTVTVTQGDGEDAPTTTRKIVQLAAAPISVGGSVRAGFDLVWYFSIDDTTGKLAVSKVYCLRQNASAAGFTLSGPEMTDVTSAQATIYAKILTNPLNPNANAGTVEVVTDPQGMTSDNCLTWLLLYEMSGNAVTADYRAQSLANVQVYR